MQDNINDVINKSLVVKKDGLKDNIKSIIAGIKQAIDINKEPILLANNLDKNRDNGFIIDFSIIDNIFNLINKEDIVYGDVTLSQKDDEIIYGTQIKDKGNVCVINDGNPYTIIEIALRNIMAGNTTILVNTGYMFGSNTVIIKLIQEVLTKYNVSEELIQMYVTDDYDEVLSNYANLDLVICIGDHELQSTVLSKAKNEIIVSGYTYYDIYVEDDKNIDFIKELINSIPHIQLFVKEGINIDYKDAIVVSDIDEAIGEINYIGSNYSAAIFTSDTNNASKFVKEVKSKIVTVNTSPSIETLLDIKQKDLYNEKTIIYPNNIKLDGIRATINE